jgi:hypothetical protein
MKGDASVWRTSHFRISARRATLGASPFAMKCKTRLVSVHLQNEEKGAARTRGTFRIRSPCPKISDPALSLSLHLAIF